MRSEMHLKSAEKKYLMKSKCTTEAKPRTPFGKIEIYLLDNGRAKLL